MVVLSSSQEGKVLSRACKAAPEQDQRCRASAFVVCWVPAAAFKSAGELLYTCKVHAPASMREHNQGCVDATPVLKRFR